jgi:polyhydroxybutyrate depolymerase
MSTSSNPATAPTSTAEAAAATTAAATDIFESTTTSERTSGCIARSAPLTTTNGRHVVVRASGVTRPAPTIIVMHGYTGTPEAIEKFSELTDRANARGVAVVYPEGTATPAGGFGWSTGAALFSTSGTDDVAALGEMLDAAIDTGCVDSERVIIAGESNGAGMALVAICDERMRSRFLAAVLVIPAIDDAVLTRCDRTKTMAIGVSVVAGKLDETVGFAEGRPPFLGAEQSFQTVASLVNGCPPQTPLRFEVDDFVERFDMSGCAGCTEMFAIADGTHTWPGSSHGTGDLRPGTFALSDRLVALALDPGQRCLT